MAVTILPPEAWSEWGGNGPPLVFAHANGFPPATYRMFLEELSRQFQTTAFAIRALWQGSESSSIASWRELAGDFGQALSHRWGRPVIGVGHSLGGTLSIMAAAADASLFSALVLIDPVVFAGFHAIFWGALKGLGFSRRLPLIRGARRRRDRSGHRA